MSPDQPLPLGDDQAERAVSAVLAGDPEAFRLLVERESGAVLRICYRVLRDPEDAEDAAQDAFVLAYRSLASWRGGRSIRGVVGPDRRSRGDSQGEESQGGSSDRSG